jgi:hypothetical protein
VGGRCLPCPLGTFKDGDEQPEYCTPCLPGTVSSDDRTECLDAPIPSTSLTPAPSQKTPRPTLYNYCPLGQYLSGAGEFRVGGVCLLCPYGTYKEILSSPEICDPCPAGTVSSDDRQECLDAPAN